MDLNTVPNDLESGSLVACNPCKKRKVKCDRVTPQCSNCLKHSRLCEYPTEVQRPGPRPGTHRRKPATHSTNSTKRLKPMPAFTEDASTDLEPFDDDTREPSSTLPRNGFLDSIVRPSHKPSDDDQPKNIGSVRVAFSSVSMLQQACTNLGISVALSLQLIEIYFDTMIAFSLFHRPSFGDKLSGISSIKQLEALLAAMFSFACRHVPENLTSSVSALDVDRFLARSQEASRDSLEECGDNPPPLVVLQAMFLAAFMLITRGVRGRAWRRFGECIRLAYEMKLHQVDAHPSQALNHDSAVGWIDKEEQRRLWWAIFELDVFTSNMMLLPAGIDPTSNKTWLPSPDENWYSGDPAKSTFLALEPTHRWKNLRDCGNKSWTAWFLVISSFKWEAKMLINSSQYFAEAPSQGKTRRQLLSNHLQSTLMALPDELRINGAYLGFKPTPGRYPNLGRAQDHGRYSVQIISQIVELLVCHDEVSSDAMRDNYPIGSASTTRRLKTPDMIWQRFLHAADVICDAVRNSCPQHFRYCNPNLSTAIWMAAAALTTASILKPHLRNPELTQSSIDLLVETLRKYIEFWDCPRNLLANLAALEGQLKTAADGRRVPARASNGPSLARQASTPLSVAAVGTASSVSTPSTALTSPAATADVANPDAQTKPNDFFELFLDNCNPSDILLNMDYATMFGNSENWDEFFLPSAA